MIRFTRLCCCTALLVAAAACAKADNAATDTAAPAAAAPPAPAPLALADLAGTWNVTSIPETGDTTPIASVLKATGDTTGWTLAVRNRKPVALRIVAVGGDSVVTESAPFESVLRKGVMVTNTAVWRMKDGKLTAATTAHYAGVKSDSVLRLRTEGTKAP